LGARKPEGFWHVLLGFAWWSDLAAKIADYGYWICLDFLGFSRPNLDLSIGYTKKVREIISQPFLALAV